MTPSTTNPHHHNDQSGGTKEMTEHGRRSVRFTRDFFVATTATLMLVYETLAGGGRPAVLSAAVTLLVSPIVMRVDEARRNGKGDGSNG